MMYGDGEIGLGGF